MIKSVVLNTDFHSFKLQHCRRRSWWKIKSGWCPLYIRHNEIFCVVTENWAKCSGRLKLKTVSGAHSGVCTVLQRVRVWRSVGKGWRGSSSLPASLRPTISSWSTSPDTWPGPASTARPVPGCWDKPLSRLSSSTLLSGTQGSPFSHSFQF